MLSVCVLVVRSGEDDAALVDLSVSSAELSCGVPVLECGPEDVMSCVKEAETSVVHVVPAGTIVMPDFHRSMLTTLEYQGVDYTVCRCLMVGEKAEVVEAASDRFTPAQMVMRRWAFMEADTGSGWRRSAERVKTEYHGVEVPHVLCVGLRMNA